MYERPPHAIPVRRAFFAPYVFVVEMERRTLNALRALNALMNCCRANGFGGGLSERSRQLEVMTNGEDLRSEREYPDREYPHGELTWRINGAFFRVHRDLGFGHLESAYRKAMAVELEDCGIPVAREVPFELFHRGVSVGFYRADLIAASSVIIEVKTGPVLDPAAMAQLRNYLKISGLQVGLILHFGPKPRIRRVIATRDGR